MVPAMNDAGTAGLDEDHELLCAAVREAGAVAMRYYGGSYDVREKKPGDPVSEADLAVNDALRDRLCGARPDYGWLSEETADTPERMLARRTWIVDPIDGTKGFIAENAEFAVSVALVEGERPIAGVVFNPATDEFFDALKGGGARLNGQRLRVTTTASLDQARLGTSYNELRRKLWAHLFAESEIAPVDAIAYKMVLVANGRFDAIISRRPKSDWDIAAGDIIVHEAGGVVRGLDGGLLHYNRAETRHPGLVASNPLLYPTLCARLALG